MDKQIVVYPFNGKLFSNHVEWHTGTKKMVQCNMWNGGLPINIPMCYPLKLWMWPDLEKKKVFADVIKILEKRSSQSPGQNLNPMTSIFIRDRRKHRHREEKIMWKHRQRLMSCSQKPRKTWSHQKLEEAEKDSSLVSTWEVLSDLVTTTMTIT